MLFRRQNQCPWGGVDAGGVMSLRVLTGNRVDGGTSPEMGNPGGEEEGCAGF